MAQLKATGVTGSLEVSGHTNLTSVDGTTAEFTSLTSSNGALINNSLTLQSTGDAILRIDADTDNGPTELDNPHIIMTQDGKKTALVMGFNGGTTVSTPIGGGTLIGGLDNYAAIYPTLGDGTGPYGWGLQLGVGNDTSTGATVLMTLRHDNQNVGIGTNNPDSSAKLEVNGDIKCQAINFGSAANTLEDYEEGTWTPTVSFNGSAPSGYGSQSGRYIKVGKKVFIQWSVTATAPSTSTSGYFRITGIPFTFDSSGGLYTTGPNMHGSIKIRTNYVPSFTRMDYNEYIYQYAYTNAGNTNTSATVYSTTYSSGVSYNSYGSFTYITAD